MSGRPVPGIPRDWSELWQPGRLRPMLARRAERPFSSPAYRFEIKWDGYRCLAFLDGGTFLQSRRGHDLTPLFPELARLHEVIRRQPAVLDGEIVAVAAGRPSFAALQQRAGFAGSFRDRPGGAASAAPVVFIAFDLLGAGGEVLAARPLEDRLARLHELVPAGERGPVLLSQGVAGAGEALFAAARRQGLEGIVAKRLDSPYLPGSRTSWWQKIKSEQTVEAVVGGVAPGGHGGVGALLLGMFDAAGRLVYVGHVGTGFDRRELSEILSRLRARPDPPFTDPPRVPGGGVVWTEPEVVCEVAFLEWTEGTRLRHPAFRRLRVDIDPEACRLPGSEDGRDQPPGGSGGG
ncbi:MAG TPA: non-homologous end-joining DNA ligase [Thermaerobacter sp.]